MAKLQQVLLIILIVLAILWLLLHMGGSFHFSAG